MKNFLLGFLAGFFVCGVMAVLFAVGLYFGGAWDRNGPTAQLPTPPPAPAPEPAPAPVTRPEPAPVAARPRKPVPAKFATPEDNLALENVYRAKFETPDYTQWMARNGIPQGNQSSPEERAVQAELRRLAAKVQAPADATLFEIPLQRDGVVRVDGVLEEAEWRGAFSQAVGRDGKQATLHLKSDGTHLFIACDATDETTETGYDQLRFFWHLTTSDLIINERLHVGISKIPARVLRQTRITGPGKNTDLTDWNVCEHTDAISVLTDHRIYEAKLVLAEMGLNVGVPFGGRVEVETDPTNDANGKSERRVMLGEWGTQLAPIWFRIGPRADAPR